MISENDKIALVVCSNGKKIEDRARLEKLEVVLKEMSLVPVFSTYVYEEKFGRSALAKWRANELMKFYEDDGIKAIFDISGGISLMRYLIIWIMRLFVRIINHFSVIVI